jgi:hypothetical protein
MVNPLPVVLELPSLEQKYIYMQGVYLLDVPIYWPTPTPNPNPTTGQKYVYMPGNFETSTGGF